MNFITNHVHVWRNLLEQAGSTLEDIPRSGGLLVVLVDRVQPAVLKATAATHLGRGLSMSGEAADTQYQFFQFLVADNADYVTRDGRLVIDDPEVEQPIR